MGALDHAFPSAPAGECKHRVRVQEPVVRQWGNEPWTLGKQIVDGRVLAFSACVFRHVPFHLAILLPCSTLLLLLIHSSVSRWLVSFIPW